MIENYTKEQFWKLYETLPEELKTALFAEETSEAILNACEASDIDKVSEVARIVGRVLVGLLPPEDFQKTLQLELELDTETATTASSEINQYIFAPIKNSLARLYNTEPLETSIAPEAAPEEPIPDIDIDKPDDTPSSRRNYEERKGSDTYREPLE